MKNKSTSHPTQYALTLFLVLSLALVAFLTYRDILGYFFTAADAFTLIDTSRIQSLGDLVGIFTQPLMSETGFLEAARFYRPISTLSYSVDYSIWKLNPFGYQLTDLILHILVSVLVFFLIRFLTNGKPVTAWLGAVIFTIHPILVESVPATARRQDILAALFLLISLLLFFKHLSTLSHPKDLLLLSIFFYALAFGSKEIAIILPFLIFTYLFLFSFESLGVRIIQAVQGCLLYFLATFLLLAWRTYVLQGIGGYVTGAPQSPIYIVTTYILDLLYPLSFWESPFDPSIILLSFALLVTAMGVIGIHQWDKIKHWFVTDSGKLVLWGLIWLSLPLGLYLLTQHVAHRYMYISVIPFSAILATLLVASSKRVTSFGGALHPGSSYRSLPIQSAIASFGVFVVIAGLSGSLLVYSPLVRTYGEWEDSGKLSSMFLDRVSGIIPELPNDAIIQIEDFPRNISSYDAVIPRAKEVGYLLDYSIKSWLDLSYPGNHMQVVIGSITRPTTLPEYLDLEVKKGEDSHVVIVVNCEGSNSTHR